jgi:type IV pilus assembly protein PilW
MIAERNSISTLPSARLPRSGKGFTLVELMVTLAITSFLLIGATTVYMQGRSTFRVNDTIARLQEDARYVLDTIEPDIRMAGYFGLRARSERVQGRATPLDPVPTGLGVSGDCGVNWAIDLDRKVDGDNNVYGWACPAFGAGAKPDADTLVVRRAAEDPEPSPLPGWIYIQAARFRDSELFVGPAVPPGFAASTTASHRLISHGYYVSQSSDADPATPSLRRKVLAAGPAVPAVDEEILSGVEDMQIQIGVDTDPVGTSTRGSVNRYVNLGDPLVDPTSASFNPDAQIIAVRIWLRLRASRRENGYIDDTSYVYADQNAGPFDDQNPGFRRILISKTIFLRNARTTI